MPHLPTLTFTTVSRFDMVWQDRTGQADMDLGVWRPVVPAGTWVLGDYAQGDYRNPARTVLALGVVNDDPDSPALRAPIGFTSLWDYRISPDSPAHHAVWALVPPPGYVACGSIATTTTIDGNGYPVAPRPGDMPHLVCVRADLARFVGSALVQFVWSDAGSGNPRDLSLWRFDRLNIMVASSDERRPPAPFYIPAHAPASPGARQQQAKSPNAEA